MDEKELLFNMIVELRRGTLSLAVLSQLREPQYGYSLLQLLEQKQLNIEANTLYPLLRRLETQGLLESNWDTSESRPRKYYQLSPAGAAMYEALKSEWEKISREMKFLFEEDTHE